MSPIKAVSLPLKVVDVRFEDVGGCTPRRESGSCGGVSYEGMDVAIGIEKGNFESPPPGTLGMGKVSFTTP